MEYVVFNLSFVYELKQRFFSFEIQTNRIIKVIGIKYIDLYLIECKVKNAFLDNFIILQHHNRSN